MNFFQAIKNTTYRIAFLIGLALIYLAIRLTGYVDYVADHRTGVQLYDPIIDMLPPPADYSTYIFLATYGIILMMIFYGIFRQPIMLIQYCYGLAFIKFIRCLTIWNIPLEPPTGIIRLHDVLIQSVTPHGIATTKDLFFSGHAATTLFAALLITHPTMRKTGLMIALIVAFLILNQRVHYSVDILGGWLMAFLCYQIVQYASPILAPQMINLKPQQQKIN